MKVEISWARYFQLNKFLLTQTASELKEQQGIMKCNTIMFTDASFAKRTYDLMFIPSMPDSRPFTHRSRGCF